MAISLVPDKWYLKIVPLKKIVMESTAGNRPEIKKQQELKSFSLPQPVRLAWRGIIKNSSHQILIEHLLSPLLFWGAYFKCFSTCKQNPDGGHLLRLLFLKGFFVMLTNLKNTFLNKNLVNVHVIRHILFAITIFLSFVFL